MILSKPSYRVFGMLLIASVLLISSVDAQPGKSLDVIELDYHRDRGAPRALPGSENHIAYLVNSVSIHKDRKWTGLVTTSHPINGTVRFDRLQHGEIIPLFGTLYRVEFGTKLIRMKPEEFPKGITIEKDSFTVPLMRDETGSGQITFVKKPGETDWVTVFVSDIHPADGKNKEPVAFIKIEDARNKALAVRLNETVKLKESEWTVRSIVPRDKERRLHGWVEFSRKK